MSGSVGSQADILSLAAPRVQALPENTGINANSYDIVVTLVRADTANALSVPITWVEVELEQLTRRVLVADVSITYNLDEQVRVMGVCCWIAADAGCAPSLQILGSYI